MPTGVPGECDYNKVVIGHLNKVQMKIKYALIILILTSFSCKRKSQLNYDAFFEQSFEFIKENSIKKNEVNWIALKRTVKDSIKRFETNEEVYNAIGYTIMLVDDGHSVFIPANTPNSLTVDTLIIPSVTSRIIDNNIAYLKLSGFVANDSLSKLYALNIRKSLLELDHYTNISGWIIDLRSNSGGKLSNESLGISPLFENPLIGISCNNKNDFREITCTSNYFTFGNFRMDSLNYDSQLKNKNRKIAVLVSEKTVSAGEFLALAFKFQNNTKLFGEETKGKTSHLRLITFKSDAKLLLAIENYCDRDKNIVEGGLIPDIECSPEESLPKAIGWIKNAL
jgi:hypothetical protein